MKFTPIEASMECTVNTAGEAPDPEHATQETPVPNADVKADRGVFQGDQQACFQ